MFISPDETLRYSVKILCVCVGVGGFWASQVALVIKNPPVNEGDVDMWLSSLGWEDAPEEKMASHTSILARRLPQTEEPGGLQSTGNKESDMTEHLRTTTGASVYVCVWIISEVTLNPNSDKCVRNFIHDNVKVIQV